MGVTKVTEAKQRHRQPDISIQTLTTSSQRITPRSVTFRRVSRLQQIIMRWTFVTSVLLVLALATSVSGCLAGCGSQQPVSCSHSRARQQCVRKKSGSETAGSPACFDVLKSLPGRCGVRSFAPFQFVAFRAFVISAPLQPTAGNISAPSDSVIIVSSNGSPETDRGPPAS